VSVPFVASVRYCALVGAPEPPAARAKALTIAIQPKVGLRWLVSLVAATCWPVAVRTSTRNSDVAVEPLEPVTVDRKSSAAPSVLGAAKVLLVGVTTTRLDVIVAATFSSSVEMHCSVQTSTPAASASAIVTVEAAATVVTDVEAPPLTVQTAEIAKVSYGSVRELKRSKSGDTLGRMGQLVPCPACRAGVSPEAKTCPQCGQPMAKPGGALLAAGCVLGLLGLALFFGGVAAFAYGVSRMGTPDEETFGAFGLVTGAASIGVMLPAAILRYVGGRKRAAR